MKNNNLELLNEIHHSLKENISNFDKFNDQEYYETTEEYKKYEDHKSGYGLKISWFELINLAKKLNEVNDASRYEVLRLVYEIWKNDFYDFFSLQSDKNAKKDFKNLFRKWEHKNSGIHLPDEHWHEFVRLSRDFEKFATMRNSLLEIINNNPLLKNQIFEFQFEKILTKLPDRKARLQNLELLYDRFIPIYKKIITQISFENKYIKSKIPYPKGIVLWNETILQSRNSRDSQVISLLPKREFDTPENTFLSLCMKAILQKIIEIQTWKKQPKFDKEEISIISKITFGTRQLIKYFPFSDTIVTTEKSLQKIGLQNSLKKYHKTTQEQFYNKSIRNKQYLNLLYWYDDFNNEIKLIDKLKQNSGDWLTESTRSIDTLYEYYIFFNLMNNFSKQENCVVYNIKWNLEDNKHHSFDFNYNDKTFRFFLSFEIEKEQSSMSLRHYTPDFMIQSNVNHQNIIVMDAKNTSDPDDKLNYKNIIENYMHQSKSTNGMIIWGADDSNPNYHLENSEFKWDFCKLDVDNSNLSELTEDEKNEIQNKKEENLLKIREIIFTACDRAKID